MLHFVQHDSLEALYSEQEPDDGADLAVSSSQSAEKRATRTAVT